MSYRHKPAAEKATCNRPADVFGASAALARWLRHRGLLAVLVSGASVLACAATAASASAASFTVKSTADEALATASSTTCETAAHTCTLRAAVQAADNAKGTNTIELPAGEYKLTIKDTSATSEAQKEEPALGDLDVLREDTLTIKGAGSGSTIINANHIDRAFAVHEGAGLTLSGMTIENGEPATASSGAQSGGAIYSDGALTVTGDVRFQGNAALKELLGGAIYSASGTGSSLAVSGATFLRNNAELGGAIYLDQPASASISGSQFTDNHDIKEEKGGAIYGQNGGLSVESSSFTGNNAEFGGAIYWDGNSALAVSGSSFIGNDAGFEDGGAIYDAHSTEMTLTSDRFVGNSGGYGGALYLDSEASAPTYKLNSDEFDDNVSNHAGGAIAWDKGALSSSGSSFVQNVGEEGGGLYLDSGKALSLVNATISENIAAYGGGLDYAISTPTSLTNDTIAYNSALHTDGGGIYGAAQATAAEGATGVRNTIIAENEGGDCGHGSESSTFAAAIDVGYNLGSDETCFTNTAGHDKVGVNPLLGTPEANGGPVLTDALEPGSPAIDAGNNEYCPATDARGIARSLGGACDIGAYEAVPASLALTNSAPTSAIAGIPITYALSATDSGPGASTATTITDQLPAGATLYGATPSQGTCSSAGSPAKVTCKLGTIEAGKSATVALVVGLSAGSVTNTATVTNREGASASASATTNVTPAVSGAAASATTGEAKSIGDRTATLNGSLAGVSGTTSYFFQYGTTNAYGLASAVQSTSASGNVSSAISGLEAKRTYHYRIVAVNGGGISYGADRTFNTAAPPKLGIRLKHAAARKLRYKVAGKLFPPAGFGAAKECSGTVVVMAKHGKKVLARRRVKLTNSCSYQALLKIRRARLRGRGKLTLSARFLGNSVFSPAVSAAIKARFR
jgi:hypothetical protein